MKIAAIYHVPYEKLGQIEDWILKKGHELIEFPLYKSKALPKTGEFDLLILMGGPMSVNDEDTCPWLLPEKELILQTMNSGKSVLGICLGAQLIASALGSKVYPGKHKEIGWFPVRFNSSGQLKTLFSRVPAQATVFHWHGETFDLPADAIPLAESDLTRNQGFIHNKNVLAVQFHIEMKPENISMMINNCGDELVNGPFIQQAEKIRSEIIQLPENHRLLEIFLNYFETLMR